MMHRTFNGLQGIARIATLRETAMTKDIISKIRKHLENPVDTECAVVYLLAEVRKVIDDEKPRPWPLALWLHCNWALHVDLSLTSQGLAPLISRLIEGFVWAPALGVLSC